jgi:glycosyltransferase involved in cell wall biosynthesis
MKIAVIYHRFGPYHIARLNELGGNVETIGIELSGLTDDYEWDKVFDKTIFKRVTLFPDHNSLYLNIKVIKKKLYSVLNELKPDVVAINGYSDKGALLALKWCLKNKVNNILMSDSTFYDEKRSFLRELIKKKIISLYDSALVGGFRQKDYLVFLGYEPEKIFYGYSVVDNNYFEQETARLKPLVPEIKSKYKIKNDFFLASLRFLPRKNILTLIHAYSDYLKKNKIGYDLVILGDGNEKMNIKRTIKQLNLENNIHLPGFLQYNQIIEFYASAKVFIHPSLREQWGLVVNEAMASGLPIIISDTSGCAANLVVDGVNGFIFDPHDSLTLTELMQKFHFNEKLISEMGEQSRVFIKQWSINLFARNMLKSAEKAKKSKSKKKLLSRVLLDVFIYSKIIAN